MTGTNLKAIREHRKVSASDLAAMAGVARQTIYAIEAGSFIPNTSVALQLAKALDVPVEELFFLAAETNCDPRLMDADLIDGSVPITKGMPVRLCRVGSRLIAVPVQIGPAWLPGANAVAGSRFSAKSVSARMLVDENAIERTVLIAGCDPAISVLERFVMGLAEVDVAAFECSSRRALNLLKAGKVHIAGMHLCDAETGEFNLPFVRKEFPQGGFAVVNYASWEQGFVVQAGNPNGIRTASDLPRRTVKIVNREAGAGSRDLLDQILAEAGIASSCIRGYERIASGHLAGGASSAIRGSRLLHRYPERGCRGGVGLHPARSRAL